MAVFQGSPREMVVGNEDWRGVEKAAKGERATVQEACSCLFAQDVRGFAVPQGLWGESERS
nr:hypothetical protein [uncultured Cohaesibacter sp.]